MKAIILAAGRGSRMKSLTDDRPKCLIKFNDKPLIDMQLEALREAGIKNISVVTGYKRELIKSRELVEFHNPLWSSTQMVSSLEYADSWLSNWPCLVSYSDIFYESAAIRSLVQSNAPISITYDPNWYDMWSMRFQDPLQDAETFKIDSADRLIEIGRTPTTLSQIQGQYMGLLKFTPEGWSELKRIRSFLSQNERDAMHMTTALQKVIDAQLVEIAAVPYKGKWGEIDSQSDLEILTNWIG